jgi:acyl-homoserine-lactone acylase
MFNILYADKEDNIFYVSNGKIPYRNPDPKYHWNSTLPGNTRATLWEKFKPFSELPQHLNPASGYLFNTNHSPFLATAENENLNPANYDKNDGYETYHNNRSRRAKDLIDSYSKISFEDLKKIKFDRQLPKQILYPYGYSSDSLFMVDESKYPALAPLITSLKNWDHVTNPDSKGALVYNLAYYHISKAMKGNAQSTLTLAQGVEVYQHVYDYFMKNFGTIDLVLGDVQKLVRGKEEWPQGGMPDVLSAVMSKNHENGKKKMVSGDAYIGFVKFPKDGSLPIIETVNTFGASSNPDSPHFADQRALYQAQKTKKMSLDKAQVLKTAEKIYNPK